MVWFFSKMTMQIWLWAASISSEEYFCLFEGVSDHISMIIVLWFEPIFVQIIKIYSRRSKIKGVDCTCVLKGFWCNEEENWQKLANICGKNFWPTTQTKNFDSMWYFRWTLIFPNENYMFEKRSFHFGSSTIDFCHS